ncbi:MAG: hypothetical protein ACFE8L_12185 [Candidatus Hodarchaeota archaeon]
MRYLFLAKVFVVLGPSRKDAGIEILDSPHSLMHTGINIKDKEITVVKSFCQNKIRFFIEKIVKN